MIDEKFILYWGNVVKEGKQKYIIKRCLHFFVMLFILDLLINKFAFGDTSLVEYIMDANWKQVLTKLGIWIVGSLLASFLQFWTLNKKYEKLKSGN